MFWESSCSDQERQLAQTIARPVVLVVLPSSRRKWGSWKRNLMSVAIYWIELLTESNQVKSSRVSKLLKEAGELTAIAVASIKTSRQHSRTKARKS